MITNATTQVKIEPFPFKIKRKEPILLLGSCFVEHLAPLFKSLHYQSVVNPMGVVFHPAVLSKICLMGPEEFQYFHFEQGGVWKNYLLGPPFFAESQTTLQAKILEAKAEIDRQFATARHIIITLGTAFCYLHKDLGLVGKCHKQPAQNFTRTLSDSETLASELEKLINWISTINPTAQIIFTISPVRHTRDGLPENFISKSTLRVALHTVMKHYPSIHYFPAYELMVDELRDYKYYQEDLIHPSREAIKYIWYRFSSELFPKEEQKTNQLSEQYENSKSHIPFAPFGSEFEKWQLNLAHQRHHLEQMLKRELDRPDFMLTKA